MELPIIKVGNYYINLFTITCVKRLDAGCDVYSGDTSALRLLADDAAAFLAFLDQSCAEHLTPAPAKTGHRYRLSVLGEEGGTPTNVYHVESSLAIAEDLLSVAGLLLDGGLTPEFIQETLPVSQSYVAIETQ